LDRLCKRAVDTVTQKKETALYQVLTHSGQTVEDSSGHTKPELTDGTM